MRKLIIYTLSLLIAFQSANAADFTVTGKIKGLTNGSTATLKNVFNGQALASGNIADGVFVLKGTVNEGMLLQLSFSAAPQINIEMFIGNEAVVIEGDLAAPDQIKLTGSILHQTYEKFRIQFAPLKDKLNAIVPLIQAETAQTPKRDSLINLFNSYKQVLLNETVGFANANPASVVSSFALFAVGPLFSGPQELESTFNTLQTESGLLDGSPICDLPEIELQRWVCITVAVNGKTVDVYYDGKLARSCVLPTFYKVDAGGYSAKLLGYGGFGGQISRTIMYDVALNPEQVYKIYMAGPEPITSVGEWFASFFAPGVNIAVTQTK